MLGVMVVDKQRQMYAIYRSMLHWEQYGFEILTYCDSEAKAVEYFCEYRHDLVISDVKLRQGDLAAETAEGIRSELSCDPVLV